jgi:small subunit ribosomal protein S30e
VHGSLSRAGKVRGQTPKVEKQKKNKKPRGRAYQRLKFKKKLSKDLKNKKKNSF